MQDIAVTPTLLDFATTYAAEYGWAVFPCHGIDADGKCTCGHDDCKSPGKHPRTKNGSLDATLDLGTIEGMFDHADLLHLNIGIATGPVSQLVVVDVDQGKGADINDLIIGDIDQRIFNTVKIKTGNGLHFYYSLPPGVTIKNSASRLGKFIDVRGEGGYVIAPPSKHISGRDYEMLSVDANGRIPQPLPFPQDWLDKLAQPLPPTNGSGQPSANGSPFVVPAVQPGIILPDSIDQGKRNNELTKIAGALRSKGLSEGAIYAALAVENVRICKPPLDDKEVHLIAHSVGRYKPHDVLNQVADDPNDPTDYENTLVPYLYGEFKTAVFEEKELLAFDIGKRDIAIIQAATNAGKTTLLRNVGLCMAAGRAFMPFYDGRRPVKIAYFDFENDAQDVQRDLGLMDKVFSDAETESVAENLIVIPKGLKGGELFQFNTHETWANDLIRQNSVEFIIVDNISAAYDLNDENSNAEVTKKVIKPLLKMAYKCDCAFLFAHHYGKGKASELEHAGVHAGRGASALQALSRTVINMKGNVSEGEQVTVECVKRKANGGQGYAENFILQPDRWFHMSSFNVPVQKPTAWQAIRTHLRNVQYPSVMTMAEIIEAFESDYSEVHIKRAVLDLYKDGFIDRPKHGHYCGKPQTQKPSTAPPVKNYYDKDDE